MMIIGFLSPNHPDSLGNKKEEKIDVNRSSSLPAPDQSFDPACAYLVHSEYGSLTTLHFMFYKWGLERRCFSRGLKFSVLIR